MEKNKNLKEVEIKISGKEWEEALKDIGGTMPEELPTPEKSLKEIEKNKKDGLINHL